MRLRAYVIAGIAAAALVLAMVTATMSSGSLLGAHHMPAPPPGSTLPVPPHQQASPGPAGDGVPRWFPVTMTVLLALYLLGLLILIALSRRGRGKRDERLHVTADDSALDAAWDGALSVDLENAAQAQLAALSQGTPRNAIVACWMGLQAATQGEGLPANRAETPDEFTVRAMRSLELDPGAIGPLSALYREARFSDHAMDEEQRDQAGRALTVLADQLSARRTGPRPGCALEQASR